MDKLISEMEGKDIEEVINEVSIIMHCDELWGQIQQCSPRRCVSRAPRS